MLHGGANGGNEQVSIGNHNTRFGAVVAFCFCTELSPLCKTIEFVEQVRVGTIYSEEAMVKMRDKIVIMAVCCVLMISARGFAGAASTAEVKSVLFNPSNLTEESRDVKDADEYTLPTSRLNQGQQGDIKHLEGKITKVLYKAPMNVSTLQIYKYYEKILLENGFTILFKGNGEELGSWQSVYYKDTYSLAGKQNYQRYISAQKGDVYVAVYATLGWNPYVNARVDVVETEPVNEEAAPASRPASKTPEMTQQLPASDNAASLLEQKFTKRGSVIITGVRFKEGSDEITDDSEPSIREAAAIIRRRPGMNFSVIYYTDSIGTPEYCKALSKRRADNFVQALVMHDIDKSRLSSVGAGWLPVESLPANREKASGNRIELIANRDGSIH